MTHGFQASLAVVAVFGALAAACTHEQNSQTHAARSEPIETTTPAAAVTTNSLTVAGPIVTACHIRFDDYRTKAADRAPRFAFDESGLLPPDEALLDKVAACVTHGPLTGRRLELVGRADPRGEIEYNFLLGERRANSVGSYLESAGVRKHQIEETSRGKLDATGTDEAGWARDRRVDVLLL